MVQKERTWICSWNMSQLREDRKSAKRDFISYNCSSNMLHYIQNSDLSTALWIGFTLTTFSYLAIVTLVYLDWRQEILIQMREIVNSNTIMLNQQSRPMDSVYTLPGVNYNHKQIFYLLAFLCTVVYGGVLPFNYLASNFKIKTL